MFIVTNKVRLHDTDMTGNIYYPQIFRFAEEALEEWMSVEGVGFKECYHNPKRHNKFGFTTYKADCELHGVLEVGDEVIVCMGSDHLKKCRFEICCDIYKTNHALVAKVKTYHAAFDLKTKKIIPIPEELKVGLLHHPFICSSFSNGKAA